MFKKILAHPTVHLAILGGMLTGVLVCVFPELIPRFSWVVNHAQQLMLFYLFAGLLALFLKQPKLTFIFFGGCVLLCFFLKYSLKDEGFERRRQWVRQVQSNSPGERSITNGEIKIVHINLTNANNREEISTILEDTDADIVSLHEVTPDWGQWLTDSLESLHPYHHMMLDLGIFGVAIYSKLELVDVDTFYYQGVPNLRSRLEKDGRYFYLISVHTQPALDEFSKRQLKEHLNLVKDTLNGMDEPLLVVGDFNAVSWSEQIQLFLDGTDLIESRRGFVPSSFSGKISFLDIPLDHIFYSGEFNCNNFQKIMGESGRHLGIMGNYKYVIRDNHAERQGQ
ncbi:MAG: endonuclease/exonuclease/phosphatase family protein [Bacteroidota bacterium]